MEEYKHFGPDVTGLGRIGDMPCEICGVKGNTCTVIFGRSPIMHCPNHTPEEIATFRKEKRARLERTWKQEELWALFHRKWTRDVDTEGYNKEEWMQLEAAILHFMKEQPKPPEPNWCRCPDESQVDWDGFGGGICRRCKGHTF